MTLPFIAGAVSGIIAIVNGLSSGDSDAAASGVIFGGLAIVIAGGLGLLYGMGVIGILKRGNPIPAVMVTVFTIVIVLGAARRSLTFDGGFDVLELVVWLVAVAGAITILVTTSLRSSKTWMAAKNRQFIAQRTRR